MNEEWKPVVGFETHYHVSNLGRVKRVARGSGSLMGIRKLSRTHGYATTTLWKHNKEHGALVHRLVAEAFIPNPENKPEVNHKNGIRDDNRVENLEWSTVQENRAYTVNVLQKNSGTRHHASKVTENNLIIIHALYRLGYSLDRISSITGVNRGTAYNILRGKSYIYHPIDFVAVVEQMKQRAQA